MSSVDDWLQAARRFPLLTADEELVLARQVQAWLQHPAPCPRPIERRGQRARRRMIEANLRLVHSGWLRYGAHLPIEPIDLLQEGAIGLARAVEKFDPARGYKFSTYAYWWIRQAIGNAGDRDAGPIRLQPGSSLLIWRLLNGHQLSPADERTARMMLAARRPLSLDATIRRGGGEAGDATWSDVLPDQTVGGADQQLAAIGAADDLARLDALMVCHLTAQQRQIVSMLWGTHDGVEQTHHQVARRLGVKLRAVRAAESAAQQLLHGPPAPPPPRPAHLVAAEQLQLALTV
jgi:RNA polymerase sigma factor (sigma-70 family)